MLNLAALCFGVFVALAHRMLFGAMLGRPVDLSERGILIFNGLSIAAPFICLAYRGSTRLLPWLTGIGLTLWLWWSWTLNGVAYQRAPDWSGVPLGFAAVMFFSPIFIGLACVAVDQVQREFHIVRTVRAAHRPSPRAAALLAPC